MMNLAEYRLTNRLYDAIEAGLADLNDSVLKERMVGLKAIRDQATTDAERAQATLDTTGNQAVTPEMIEGFANVAREKLRLEGGVIGGITCAHWRSASRSPIPKFASWDRNRNSCERSWPLQA
ncbi:hypothetical protein RLW55_08940 [Hyphomicrobium sp. B1]|uniref:hypothetical protein n=1 Tax=Hyphomicrobium sp. B1 TaxID=3075651 RepID=UPI003C2BF434